MTAPHRSPHTQRSIVHTDLANEVGDTHRPPCRIRRAGSRARSRAFPSGVRKEMTKICPKAAELLDSTEVDALAYLDFPYAHHRRLRANNVQERANRELKRRSRAVRALPPRKPPVRMLSAVFAEMDESWASRRRCTEGSIELVYGGKSNAPAPSYEGTSDKHARKIIGFVMANDPARGKAA